MTTEEKAALYDLIDIHKLEVEYTGDGWRAWDCRSINFSHSPTLSDAIYRVVKELK